MSDKKRRIRRILYTLILLLTGWYVVNHLEELRLLLSTFGNANPAWLLVALGAHIVWLMVIAASLQSTYTLTGIHESLRHLLPLTTAGNFLNVVAPSYGLGALAVFMADGSKRGLPAGKVSTASILYMVYDYIGFMIILPVGLIVLSMRDALSPVITASSMIAAVIASVVFTATYLGFKNTGRLKHFLQKLARLINGMLFALFRREVLSMSRIRLFADNVTDGLREVRAASHSLIIPALLALLNKASAMLILLLAAKAFQVNLDPAVLFASFTIAYLFNIVSVTPSGIGFVEGALTLILSNLGVPLAQAAAITVTYRGITFWLTLLYGLIAIRMIGYPLRSAGIPGRTETAPQAPPGYLRNEASFKRDPKLSS